MVDYWVLLMFLGANVHHMHVVVHKGMFENYEQCEAAGRAIIPFEIDHLCWGCSFNRNDPWCR
jgi:hypothetical protein